MRRVVAFSLLLVFVASLVAAHGDLCAGHLDHEAGHPRSAHADAGDDHAEEDASGCCGESRTDNADHACGFCPCLCHALAIAAERPILNVTLFVSPACESSRALFSISPPRVERPPRFG